MNDSTDLRVGLPLDDMKDALEVARRSQRNLSATWAPGGVSADFSSASSVAVAAVVEDAPAGDRTRAIVSERERTHGVFRENSEFVQDVKAMMRDRPNWNKMASFQREALDMIAHKMTRILHGDPDHVDHWDDVAGYAEKVSQTLRETDSG